MYVLQFLSAEIQFCEIASSVFTFHMHFRATRKPLMGEKIFNTNFYLNSPF